MASADIQAAVNRGLPLQTAIIFDTVALAPAATAPVANAAYTQADLTALLADVAALRTAINAIVTAL